MKKILLLLLITLLCITACRDKQPTLQGHWINTAQYFVANQDTIWDRPALIWNFREDSSCIIHQLQLGKGLTNNKIEASWVQAAGRLQFSNQQQQENWKIEQLNENQLLLSSNKNGKTRYWSFHKLLKSDNSLKLESAKHLLDKYHFELQSDDARINDLEWEAWENSFFHPNQRQTLYLPLRWGLYELDGYLLMGMQGSLSGRLNSWAVLEIQTLSDSLLQGRFFQKGQPQLLKFVPKATSSNYEAIQEQLKASWQIQFPKQEDLQSIQLMDSTYHSEGMGNQNLPYCLSKNGKLLLFRNQQGQDYFWIDEYQEDILKGWFKGRSTSNREEKVIWTKIAQ